MSSFNTRNDLPKLLLIVMAIVTMTVVLFAFLYVRMLKFDFDEKKAGLVKEIGALKEEAEGLRASMDEKSRAVAAIEDEKRAVERELESVKAGNEELRKELTGRLAALERKRKALKKHIARLEKGDPLGALKDAIDRSSNGDIRKILQDAARRVEAVEQGKPVDLEPIVVGTPETTGAVVTADRKNCLVVVNLGKKNGVEPGDRVKIYDCDGEIASAEVLSARFMLAAAYVDQFSKGKSIRNLKEGLKAVVTKK